jgi:6-pyruvoyltetrahydropterin/6-carboxytetrahydropterin synthase
LQVQVCKRAAMSCAHQLPKHRGKCQRLHGHNYVVEVLASGPIRDDGMVMDFDELSCLLRELVVNRCDHRYLNEVYPDIDTTAENLAARWLQDLSAADPRVVRVRVWETETCYAEANVCDER